ncbi:uncharacterized protein [Lolium perenne]|uniref:uncharacterized protein isoform X1 n=1 Tax=Lolium perenne TaxID=4522 RepID=UPI0021F5D9AA|nr:proline-rich receptor-like protein kinase PERK2 isoform X1 [Lolium perenne]XP_051183893.1 proline-rich receptor-like protein kinase PERK2 [Lolium perenne]
MSPRKRWEAPRDELRGRPFSTSSAPTPRTPRTMSTPGERPCMHASPSMTPEAPPLRAVPLESPKPDRSAQAGLRSTTPLPPRLRPPPCTPSQSSPSRHLLSTLTRPLPSLPGTHGKSAAITVPSVPTTWCSPWPPWTSASSHADHAVGGDRGEAPLLLCAVALASLPDPRMRVLSERKERIMVRTSKRKEEQMVREDEVQGQIANQDLVEFDR